MDRLDGLALFVAVAECGGFAAAARKTGRSTAGVSRAVSLDLPPAADAIRSEVRVEAERLAR